MFQRAHAGGAYGNHSSMLTESTVDLVSRFISDPVPLAVKLVIFDTILMHRLESSQADVKCEFGCFNSASCQLLQDLRREVQTRGWSSYRSTLACIDRLITFAVAGSIVASDVRGQWHMTDTLDDVEEVRFSD